jgi:hypothetical protein
MRCSFAALMRTASLMIWGILAPVAAAAAPPPGGTWMAPEEWRIETDGASTVSARAGSAPANPELLVAFALAPDGGWVNVDHELAPGFTLEVPVCFTMQADAACRLEIKFTDRDGSTFGRRVPLGGRYREPTALVVYLASTEYCWGGDDEEFGEPARFWLAFSGEGEGTVRLTGVGPGLPGTPATLRPSGPQLDPDRDLRGLGLRQRRDAVLRPEDPLVLDWLKQLQDTAGPGALPLPDLLGGNDVSTFNSALVAMAFILEDERERAERILDFYAGATDRANEDPRLQSFFLRGEARGFFQHVVLRDTGGTPALHAAGSDRWMGDMAWLLLACLHYRQACGSDRYDELIGLLRDLLVSWYKDADDGPGGYVQHGWRKGDVRLHEDHGHPEGNIDCYAAFRLCGEEVSARSIRSWLDRTLGRKPSLPLDLYSWRVLAYGPEAAALLDIPEFDLRYRKSVEFLGRSAVGFYHGPDIDVDNVWLDGTGHMACAFLTCGDMLRGNFYGNQLDAFIIEENLGERALHCLPYAANRSGGYQWTDPGRGVASAAAWYIFAKNRFNPLRLETAPGP